VKEQLKSDLDKKFEQEQSRLQGKATEQLEEHLRKLQPEISEVVNQVTRDALKQKAQQMGTVKEISEDAESGSLTIKVEV
jgi:vacuolar-type H+-ATPase catalytic subunit A/Vma1